MSIKKESFLGLTAKIDAATTVIKDWANGAFSKLGHAHTLSDIVGASQMQIFAMPDTANLVVLESIKVVPKNTFVWKINAPGYLWYYIGHTYADRDGFIGMASNTYTLMETANFKDTSEQMGGVLLCSWINGEVSSTYPYIPIYPGTSTYIRLALQETQTYGRLYFVPCVGLKELYPDSSKWVTKAASPTKTLYGSFRVDEPDTDYDTGQFKLIFAGDWKDNFK